MNDDPFVSVIIPAHNYGRYVAQAVRSALAQNGVRVEVIVVDDGSTDETPAVLARFSDAIRVITLEGRGVSAARNEGLRTASGDLVLFLDADDLLVPHALAVPARRLTGGSDLDLVHTPWYQWDEPTGRTTLGGHPAKPGTLLTALLSGNLFPLHAVLARRRVIVEEGGFSPALATLADWDLWLRLARRGRQWGYVPHPLAVYRIHPGSMVTNLDRFEREIDMVIGDRRRDGTTHEHPGEMARYNMYRYLTRIALERADQERAARYVRAALTVRPGARTSALYFQTVARILGRRLVAAEQAGGEGIAAAFLRLTDQALSGSGAVSSGEDAARRFGLALALHTLGHRREAVAEMWRGVRAAPAHLLRRPRRLLMIAKLLAPSFLLRPASRWLRSGARTAASKWAQEPSPGTQSAVQLPEAVRALAQGDG